jgi:hypothetical protein
MTAAQAARAITRADECGLPHYFELDQKRLVQPQSGLSRTENKSGPPPMSARPDPLKNRKVVTISAGRRTWVIT